MCARARASISQFAKVDIGIYSDFDVFCLSFYVIVIILYAGISCRRFFFFFFCAIYLFCLLPFATCTLSVCICFGNANNKWISIKANRTICVCISLYMDVGVQANHCIWKIYIKTHKRRTFQMAFIHIFHSLCDCVRARCRLCFCGFWLNNILFVVDVFVSCWDVRLFFFSLPHRLWLVVTR